MEHSILNLSRHCGEEGGGKKVSVERPSPVAVAEVMDDVRLPANRHQSTHHITYTRLPGSSDAQGSNQIIKKTLCPVVE